MNTWGRTTEFLFDNEEFFAAHVDNGAVRFGMKGVGIVQFPAGHPLHAEILALTPETAEAFFDTQVEAGRISIA